MADMTAVALRAMARDAMMQSGARGFMRFAQQGDMLLVTDAVRRCTDGARELIGALEASGFVCSSREDLLYLAPQDEIVRALVREISVPEVDWESERHPAQALSVRWAKQPQQLFTAAGRRLVMDTLRLTGQPGGKVMDGLEALRAHAAVMLRMGDRSGMYEAGRILSQWRQKEERA